VIAEPPIRRILALGGGGFTSSAEDWPLDELTPELADSDRPAICLLPTASGDPEDQIARFYDAFGPADCDLSHISLFRLGSQQVDLRRHLLSRDVIYVGGGSMLNLLALWRVHGVDSLLSEAYQRGVVLCGVSAGAMCWFDAGITRTHGAPGPAAGLGLLPGTLSVHDSTDPQRRAEFRDRVGAGMAGGWAAEDGVGLLFEDGLLTEAVTARRGARAYRVHRTAAGAAAEEQIEPRLLESDPGERPAEPVSIVEYRQTVQRRSRDNRNSLRSRPPV
jgi:peptidase E